MMKINRIFSFAVLAAALVASACDDKKTEIPEPEPAKPSLKANVAEVSFDADGGSENIMIVGDDVQWHASADADWITVTPESGVGNTIVAVAAEPNATAFDRSAVVTIAGDEFESFAVSVAQAKSDVVSDDTMILQYAEAYYAGDYWDTGGKLDNVYLNLTDMAVTNNGIAYPGSIIILDLNIPATSLSSVNLTGTYSPSKSITPTAAYTFNADEVSRVIEYNANGSQSKWSYATGGSITVSHTGTTCNIDLTLTFADAEDLHAVYSGQLPIFDDSQTYYSTLTGDVAPVLTSAQGTFYKYENGPADIYALSLSLFGNTSSSPVDNVIFMINVDAAAQKDGAIEGVYTLSEGDSSIGGSSVKKNTVVAGSLQQNSAGEIEFYGSWYRQFVYDGTQYQYGAFAPFTLGQLVITRDGSTYTLKYGFNDDNLLSPNSIGGTYTGPITFTNLGGGDNPDNPDNPDKPVDPDLPAPKPGVDVSSDGKLGSWLTGGRW